MERCKVYTWGEMGPLNRYRYIMSSGLAGWLALILTTLGGGVTGAVVTTYGTQTRQRREARTIARETLRFVEDLALRRPEHGELKTALGRLETSVMLAGLPRGLTELHADARMRAWVNCGTEVTGDPEAVAQHQAEKIVSLRVAAQAAKLLTSATWHSWSSTPYRWYRTRRLARVLAAGMPSRAQLDRERRSSMRAWEREVIRQGRRRPPG